jgi:hypothetical protein
MLNPKSQFTSLGTSSHCRDSLRIVEDTSCKRPSSPLVEYRYADKPRSSGHETCFEKVQPNPVFASHTAQDLGRGKRQQLGNARACLSRDKSSLLRKTNKAMSTSQSSKKCLERQRIREERFRVTCKQSDSII